MTQKVLYRSTAMGLLLPMQQAFQRGLRVIVRGRIPNENDQLRFMKSGIEILRRVVSVEGIKPDPKAVAKLGDWEISRTRLKCRVCQLSLGGLFPGMPSWLSHCTP